jgi:hypothetical protein
MESTILFAFSIVMIEPSQCQFRVYVDTNFAGIEWKHYNFHRRRKILNRALVEVWIQQKPQYYTLQNLIAIQSRAVRS